MALFLPHPRIQAGSRRWVWLRDVGLLRVPAHDLGMARAERVRGRGSAEGELLAAPAPFVHVQQVRAVGQVRAGASERDGCGEGGGEDAAAGDNADGLVAWVYGCGADSSPPPSAPTRIGGTGFLPADEGRCACATHAFSLRSLLNGVTPDVTPSQGGTT